LYVARIAAAKRRGFLRCIVLNANAAAVPLPDALNTFQLGIFGNVQSGRLISSVGASGKSTAFKTPANDFSEDELFDLAEQFQAILNDAFATLQANNVALPQDVVDQNQLLFNTMLEDDRLATITSKRTDFTLIRFPSLGTGPST
jgi:hypothetical protein